jgi:hypothetical protein
MKPGLSSLADEIRGSAQTPCWMPKRTGYVALDVTSVAKPASVVLAAMNERCTQAVSATSRKR